MDARCLTLMTTWRDSVAQAIRCLEARARRISCNLEPVQFSTSALLRLLPKNDLPKEGHDEHADSDRSLALPPNPELHHDETQR
jgi:hypothetical protein